MIKMINTIVIAIFISLFYSISPATSSTRKPSSLPINYKVLGQYRKIINLPALNKIDRSFFNKKIKIAIIDTGIDFKNPQLKNKLIALNGKTNAKNFGIDFSKNYKHSYTPHDDNGHGTHIAGIIQAIYPNSNFLVLKYYNERSNGQTNFEATLKSLKMAINSGVDIINYSGGGKYPSQEELELLKIAQKKGIIIVAAAGNNKDNLDSPQNNYYPAKYKLNNIITVTAHDMNYQLIPNANWGQNSVDIAAPGQDIPSFLPNGKIGLLSGTSQATAFVTGLVALLKANLHLHNHQEIIQVLIKTSVPGSSLNGKCKANGRINIRFTLDYIQNYHNKSTNHLALN